MTKTSATLKNFCYLVPSMSNSSTPRRTGNRSTPIGKTLRKSILLGVILIVSVFGFFGLFGKNGLLDVMRLNALHKNLQKENEEIERKQAELRQEILRLKDGQQLEFLARDRLGLLKSDEVLIVLDTVPPSEVMNSSPSPAPIP